MTAVATHNFAAVEDFLNAPRPGPATQGQAFEKSELRPLLHYQAAELNRWYFENWERVQLGVGALLILVLFFGAEGTAPLIATTALMLVLVATQRWLLTPEIARLGRAIAYLPAKGAAVEQMRFWDFHAAYSITEVLKLVMGFFVTAKLLLRRRKSSRRVDEIDVIDDADDCHIDRR